jgi:hypothetical protein
MPLTGLVGTGGKQLQAASDDLYAKLCEMLLWIVHRRVSDAAAWQAAFQCFLTFVTQFGLIDRTRCAYPLQTRAGRPTETPTSLDADRTTLTTHALAPSHLTGLGHGIYMCVYVCV